MLHISFRISLWNENDKRVNFKISVKVPSTGHRDDSARIQADSLRDAGHYVSWCKQDESEIRKALTGVLKEPSKNDIGLIVTLAFSSSMLDISFGLFADLKF